MRREYLGAFIVAYALHQAMAAASYSQTPSAMREFSCDEFPRDTSEAKLVARYGRDNVRRAGVVGWDDGPQDGAIVFADQADLKLEIIWGTPGETIGSIRAVGGRWRSPNGIHVGMDLKTIERRNGWPFRLAPFAREGYPGEILSWGKGRLHTEASGGCAVSIYLLPAEGARTPAHGLSSQRDFSSGHPSMQALNPRVYQLLIWYR
jgi:hypothetical protein